MSEFDFTNPRLLTSIFLVAVPLIAFWSRRQLTVKAREESAAMSQSPSKTVVVIGASWAGIKVTHALLKEAPNTKIMLVNPADEFFFNVAAPRLVCDPSAIAREKYIYSIPALFEEKHANARQNLEFVLGTATSIDLEAKTVSVQLRQDDSSNGAPSDRVIAYDYLVIASGSTSAATTGTNSFRVPFKNPGTAKIQQELDAAHEGISSAKSIVIGGAGAVGVEFAGELTEIYPDKDVTLLTNSDNVLTSLREPTRRKAAKILKQKGVKILTHKTVASAEEKAEEQEQESGPGNSGGKKKWVIHLADGETLSADLYVSTTGAQPNNRFIPKALLNKEGWVEVDDHFVTKADPSVYAVGDITHHSARLLSRIDGQVSVLIANLKSDLSEKQEKRAVYKPPHMLMVIMPMGKWTGTGQFGSITTPGLAVALIKGRDYFTSFGKSFIS